MDQDQPHSHLHTTASSQNTGTRLSDAYRSWGWASWLRGAATRNSRPRRPRLPRWWGDRWGSNLRPRVVCSRSRPLQDYLCSSRGGILCPRPRPPAGEETWTRSCCRARPSWRAAWCGRGGRRAARGVLGAPADTSLVNCGLRAVIGWAGAGRDQ